MMADPNRALQLADDPQSVVWVKQWLHEKFHRTSSHKTRQTYAEAMQSFQAALTQADMTLMSPAAAIATAAQVWAGWPNRRTHGSVSPATYNLRLAILSSFYQFLIRRYPEANLVNPITRVNRRVVEEYATAQALSAEQIQAALAKIDLSDLLGIRDFAFLAVAFTTGRRLSELRDLRASDLHLEGEQLVVKFRRCKGGKQTTDKLSLPVSQAVLRWIQESHVGIEYMKAQQALWTSVGNLRVHPDEPLTASAIRYLIQRRLGVSKVHVTRHSFAREMEAAGATISEIAAALLHSNAAVTSRYITKIKTTENPFAAKLAGKFGL